MKVIIIFFIFFLYSGASYACFPAKVPLEHRVNNASNIFVGYVTGITLDDYEKSLKVPTQSISLPQAYQLRVLIKETLKGSASTKIINPKILNCGSGKASLKEKVIVFDTDGFWFVSNFSAETQTQIEILTKNNQ